MTAPLDHQSPGSPFQGIAWGIPLGLVCWIVLAAIALGAGHG